MTEVSGVILAGGRAMRMGGGDKGLLKLGGQRLIDHVVARINPQVSFLALNANGDPARFRDLNLPVLADSIDGFAGPLAGVLAGMDWSAGSDVEVIVTVAADTPFFPTDLVERLMDASKTSGAEIVLAGTPHSDRKLVRHPTFGLWPVALRDDLRGALQGGLRKVVEWTDQHDAATAMFSNDGNDPFFNVNTPDDLISAEKMWTEHIA